jgi:CubicO group peptidase (beta-lactamase class C family)
MTQIIEQSLAGFDDYISKQMQVWPGPGLAVSIIKKGQVLNKCYGVCSVDSPGVVNPDTLFSIGSCTKAFTTMALGLLVQQGHLDWDTPIRKYMPDFELADKVASEQMTLRDLASHRSGLPRHDAMWYGSEFSREELYQRLRYIEPSKPFRYVFQYQNMMYMVAGHLIERVTGLTWEEFVAQNILHHLDMNHTTTDLGIVNNDANAASPHSGNAEKMTVIPHRSLGATAPAGAVYSSLNDMAKWMLLHMNAGKHNGEQFIDAEILREMHTAQMILPPIPEMVWRDYSEISLNTVGMGWAGLVYRGHTIVRHMGAIDGFVAQVAFIPDEDVAVIILSNMDGNLLPAILTFEVFDRMLGLESVPWSERLRSYVDNAGQEAVVARQKLAENRQTDRPHSHPLVDYAGSYEHAAYGTITIEHEDGQLTATRNTLEFIVEHYHYDTFLMTWTGMEETMLVNFYLNSDGDIKELHIPFEPTVDPIIFEKLKQNERND